ncbi:hypothetical protein ZG96_004456 [Salmonella enterica subsp. enterica serovar Java]|nr:hypothetical protein [Salmonella enterica subsp. enterica serovar Java]EJC3483662.1 hypothetical protein [Salmonella enterica]
MTNIECYLTNNELIFLRKNKRFNMFNKGKSLNKEELNVNLINPCSVNGLISIVDHKNITTIIQRELIVFTASEENGWFYSDGKTPTTRIYFITGKWVRVALSGDELAKLLKPEGDL